MCGQVEASGQVEAVGTEFGSHCKELDTTQTTELTEEKRTGFECLKKIPNF